MSLKEYTIESLGKFIKGLRDSGVSKIEFDGISVTFESTHEEEILAPALGRKVGEKGMAEIETASKEEQLSLRMEDELAQMQIDQPELYEQLLIQRELEPSGDNRNEDDEL